jgi:hypothetical protein
MARNTLVRHRNRAIFGRDPEEGGGGGTGGAGENGGAGGDGDKGEKGAKGGKEYVPPATQEEFDRIVTERVNRTKRQYADYDTLKAKAEQWDTLEAESRTEAERREREIRDEALNEAMSRVVPSAIKAAFKAEAKGVLTKEQVESLLEDLDLVKYATDEGEPDEEKIAKKVAAFAPAKGGNGQNGHGPGFGQGSGHQQSQAKRGEAGLAEAKRRFPEAFASPKS